MIRLERNKRNKWRSALMWFAILAGWVTLLFILSSQSYEEQSIRPFLEKRFSYHQLVHWLPDVTIRYGNSVTNSHQRPYVFLEFLFRKGAHLMVYAALASILFLFLRSLQPQRLFRAVGVTLAAAIIIPALDEWNQLGSKNRTGNATDILLDFTGGCIGVLICLSVLGIIRLWKGKRP